MKKANRHQQINSDFLQAAHKGDLAKLVQARLDGADVEAVHEQTGMNALHIAVGTNNLLMVRYLVEQCGARFTPDRSGRWPTVIAAECEVDDVVGDYVVETEAAQMQKTGKLAPSL